MKRCTFIFIGILLNPLCASAEMARNLSFKVDLVCTISGLTLTDAREEKLPSRQVYVFIEQDSRGKGSDNEIWDFRMRVDGPKKYQWYLSTSDRLEVPKPYMYMNVNQSDENFYAISFIADVPAFRQTTSIRINRKTGLLNISDTYYSSKENHSSTSNLTGNCKPSRVQNKF
jgi:hypothetical protein